MAKIVAGAAIAAGSITAMIVAPAMAPWLMHLAWMGVSMGASLTLGGIADDLRGGPGASGSIRQPAAARECVYGTVRKNGVVLYTTTSGHQLNQVIAWAGHKCFSIDAHYFDGREFHGNPTVLYGTQTYLYGDGQTYQDASGNNYSFGSDDVIGCEALGDAAGYWYEGLYGQNTAFWDSDCTLNGICASYIKLKYDSGRFSGMPGIKATIHGKCDIYDPRTGTTGWSNNAALCIANLLCDKEFGIGCDYAKEIDEDALIAAANICDEEVPLANGGTERRYTVNGSFDTNSSPGDIVDSMLMACEGRISYSGGKWKIYPAAWCGSDLQFDKRHINGKIQWTVSRKMRERFNRVRATYVCPVYPYSTYGYDQDNKDPNIFSGEWQPADAPEYAQDERHGYTTDVNLAEDNGVPLYMSRRYQFVTSVGQVQRCMKIYLLRNRQQGSGVLPMSLSAYKTQAQNVIQVSFPAPLNWTSKYLEVQQFNFTPKIDASGKDAPTIGCQLQVVETDPSVYSWSTSEERGIEDVASPQLESPGAVGAPTGLAIESDGSTAFVLQDGSSVARFLVSWTPPDDPFVTTGGSIQIQYQMTTSGTAQPVGTSLPVTQNLDGTWSTPWVDLQSVSGIARYCYIDVLPAFQSIAVRIRATRASGAASGWVSSSGSGIVTSPFSFSDISGAVDAAQLPVATPSAVGAIKPDGVTLTINGAGVLSAVSPGPYSTAPITLPAPNGRTVYVLPVILANPAGSFYFVRGQKFAYGTDYDITTVSGVQQINTLNSRPPQTGDTHELFGS